MLRTRVIPTLLLRKGGLVKTIKFKDHKYIGDPINAVKIFNEKEVDELIFLDIEATKNGNSPDFEIVKNIASEAFMPLAYGGGITKASETEKLFRIGIEKVVINSIVHRNPKLISEIAKISGSQSVVVSVDIKKNFFGKYEIYSHGGTRKIKGSVVDFAKKIEDLGAGEIFINAINRDGTGKGYDIPLIQKIAKVVQIPVVACGGANNLVHMQEAVQKGGASAVAAGSMFVFYGKHRAVLITYPPYKELVKTFSN